MGGGLQVAGGLKVEGSTVTERVCTCKSVKLTLAARSALSRAICSFTFCLPKIKQQRTCFLKDSSCILVSSGAQQINVCLYLANLSSIFSRFFSSASFRTSSISILHKLKSVKVTSQTESKTIR